MFVLSQKRTPEPAENDIMPRQAPKKQNKKTTPPQTTPPQTTPPPRTKKEKKKIRKLPIIMNPNVSFISCTK